MSASRALEEARPILEDLLPQIGIIPSGVPLDTSTCISSFSKWVSGQQVGQEDIAFFVGLIGAFIVVYLVDHKDAKAYVKENRICVAIPFQQGIMRELEPYAVAHGIASGSDGDLESFLKNVAA
ncbi:hypothetical protein CLV44_103188 [Marinobacterium halophilum]|uniref:Uncharacterized protein n=1 Tax=Marinobacterium halophilum TaxID=267374 RepID=A0A2P8F2G5_9GAMM|nr:hypothetical protein [Marinobacterium halophilum]PSL15904.1 hypothetical protein CLV44_103188 [Marinobacterium halophilum]